MVMDLSHIDVNSLHITRIITHGDLDGVIAAAILRMGHPEATVRLAHPAEIRSGMLDHLVDRDTAICDLPFHPSCGLWLDHHKTNELTDHELKQLSEDGGVALWRIEDSAARVAFDHFQDIFDLTHIAPMMEMVDRIDSGRLSRGEILDPGPVERLSNSISFSDPDYVLQLLDWLKEGRSLNELMLEEAVRVRASAREEELATLRKTIIQKCEVIDRLGIVRLEETGISVGGMFASAVIGDEVDAVCIIKGFEDGEIGRHDRIPYSASFYNNSFLHGSEGICDLTRLATLFDADGGGHAGACGCRVMPIDEEGRVENRPVRDTDIESNLEYFLDGWRQCRNPSE